MKYLKSISVKAAKYATLTFLILSLMVVIIVYFGHTFFVPTGERPHFEREPDIWVTMVGAIVTYLFFFTLYAFNFMILESKIKGRKKIIIAILVTVATAFIFYFIMALFIQTVSPSDNLPPNAHLGPLIMNLLFAAIIFFMSLIVYLSSQKQKMVLEYEAMKAENARSRFEALKNQLDPHFLFNTFNSLDSLIVEDTVMARNYLQQLSSVFRYVISNKESTPLENELKFARSYNELMQLRYENSLVFEFSIDEQYLCYEIVPLSIQTLIENAIKHNVLSSELPLVVTITVGPDPTVTVSNEIRPKKTAQGGSGIGLSNLTERFRLKFQKEITISDSDGLFSVILPLQSPKDIIS